MDTANELNQPRPVASVGGPPRAGVRFIAAFAVGLLATLGAAGAAAYAWDASYDGRVLPGVHVGSVDLSGLDRAAAEAALRDAYGKWSDGRLVVDTIAGDIAIPYGDVGRGPDVAAMVDAALSAGRTGSAVERALGEARLARDGLVLEPRLALDAAALRVRVRAALAPLAEAARDATIALTPDGVAWTPAHYGRTFDDEAVGDAALAALTSVVAPAEVRVDAATRTVAPDRGDAVVLAAKLAAERLLGAVAVTDGKQTWTIPAATVRSWLRLEIRPDGSVWPVVDAADVAPALAGVEKDVQRAAVSATFLTSSKGAIVGVKAGHDGRRLDVLATAEAIAAALDGRANGDAPGSVNAAVVTEPAELTTEEAERIAPRMVRLSRWTTWFPIGERNWWGANIWLPARFINGTVLLPGEKFEWWSRVGPITASRGFGMGGVIKGDHTEPTGAMGGGMCSSSTTLFNAAMRAGLKMGARSNHRYYIDRYPLGLDATVSSSQTMSFTNDMATPVLIRGYRIVGRHGVGYVRYEIWGVPDGRTVRLGRPKVWNVRRPHTETVYVDSLPTGVRQQTEWPMRGMDVSVTRVVRDRDGKVIRRDTFVSHYTVWNARFEVGR